MMKFAALHRCRRAATGRSLPADRYTTVAGEKKYTALNSLDRFEDSQYVCLQRQKNSTAMRELGVTGLRGTLAVSAGPTVEPDPDNAGGGKQP